jgi:hypothetical protein
MAAYRLVTLVGPGGVGKTRLALDVARKSHPGFREGVWQVPLAELTQPDLVPSTVMSVMGAVVPARTGMTELKTLIGDRQILLLMDNCEHLTDACATLMTEVLRSCRNLRVLASSPEPLRIDGEAVFRVLPLSLPDSGQGRLPKVKSNCDRSRCSSTESRPWIRTFPWRKPMSRRSSLCADAWMDYLWPSNWPLRVLGTSRSVCWPEWSTRDSNFHCPGAVLHRRDIRLCAPRWTTAMTCARRPRETCGPGCRCSVAAPISTPSRRSVRAENFKTLSCGKRCPRRRAMTSTVTGLVEGQGC